VNRTPFCRSGKNAVFLRTTAATQRLLPLAATFILDPDRHRIEVIHWLKPCDLAASGAAKPD
jgi:hypothetical protein